MKVHAGVMIGLKACCNPMCCCNRQLTETTLLQTCFAQNNFITHSVALAFFVRALLLKDLAASLSSQIIVGLRCLIHEKSFMEFLINPTAKLTIYLLHCMFVLRLQQSCPNLKAGPGYSAWDP
eukprot:635911-Amphidinium_carterae.1